jgi:putative glutamine amidotransferase
MQPIVITVCDVIEHNGLSWSATPAPYLDALALSGTLPVQLPTIRERLDPSALVAAASGVLVTGARSNVHPCEYGGGDEEAAKPFDRARDRTTLPLIREAVARGIPLLCICRGIQELNVAFGGTLHAAVHELPGRDDHHGPSDVHMDERFAPRQDVVVEPGGMLAGILGSGRVRVNSIHRQAIDRVADGLTVEARADDGTVEAVTVDGARTFALGVQWHPEYFVRTDAPSRALFDAFADAARGHAGRRMAA